MNFFEQIGYLLDKYGTSLIKGTIFTILLAVVGTFVGLILGMGLAFQRNLKKNKNDSLVGRFFKGFFSKLAFLYILVFRGTPMMVQAMLVFFGGNFIGLSWNPMVCGFVIIVLNTAAYMAEIVRSGINSVDVGQMEASRSLGMSNFQAMLYVIFPQALKNSIPTIGNELIVNIKDSSVLNVIGVVELYYVGKDMQTTYMTIPAFIIVAVIYLILTVIISQLLKLVERHLDDKTIKKSKKMEMELVSYDN